MRRLPSLVLTSTVLLVACGDTGTGPGDGPEVTGPDVIAAIEVSARSDVLVVGRSMAIQVEARAVGGGWTTAPPASWSTNAPAVAEVSAAGLVTAVGVGEAVITATAGQHDAQFTMRVAPDSLPIFTSAPFAGAYSVWNAFDHDLPIWSGNAGQILTWLGVNVRGLEGHDGYDWAMPSGTPLFAVGDGVVLVAGSERPWSCPILNGDLVSAKVVVLLHTAPDGERIMAMYLHLDRIQVFEGDSVVAGQPIGFSGNTGCSTGPHLHFEVGREFYQRTPNPGYVKTTDPNGWAGAQDDPWLLDERGAASSYLWAEEAAPFSIASMLMTPTPGPPSHRGPDPARPAHLHRFVPPALPPRPGR